MTRITIMGLGEAGSIYARDLAAAGADVRGFDPFRAAVEPGVPRQDDLRAAVRGADLVMSLVGADSATTAAQWAVDAVDGRPVFADLNTADPQTKSAVEAIAAGRGIPTADIAVLAPVPRARLATPLLASGGAADAVAALLAEFGVPVEVLAGPVGDAARRKLLRSVFMKGVAAVIVEALEASRADGLEEWMKAQIAEEFGTPGTDEVDRLLEGTYRHARRREHEMRDVLAMLEASGHPADMTRATVTWFQRIVAEG